MRDFIQILTIYLTIVFAYICVFTIPYLLDILVFDIDSGLKIWYYIFTGALITTFNHVLALIMKERINNGK